jgi:hypothetical protein
VASPTLYALVESVVENLKEARAQLGSISCHLGLGYGEEAGHPDAQDTLETLLRDARDLSLFVGKTVDCIVHHIGQPANTQNPAHIKQA